jgi:hypothetical protein
VVTANITPASVALTTLGPVSAANRVYDGTLTTTITGLGLNGVLGADVVGIAGLFSDPNVGIAKPVTVILTGTDGGNYYIGNPTAAGNVTATITPRVLTITADNKSMMFGGTIPPLTYTVAGSGLVGADTIAAVFSGSLYVNITGVLAGGTAPITQGTLVLTMGPGGNYFISLFVNGLLSVQ